ncbi:chemotaxis protein CheW [Sphingomonas yunnanensis]|uniref:chemotaxis protein CheW n=1 Tax=Sphingomonas yunnanensis TaxID=310400 RepID=UPI001CA7082E|nr:chemotaxis protein CheW [Sphingomonas yunnanensis]MBY9063080.1 chemotaxis protein CheW [Sphingomonas yunnanensis]
MSGAALQAVVFALGDEQFALPVEEVREILDHRAPFRVPNAPTWLSGLIDVRGTSVPVIDLRLRLGLSAIAVTPMTRMLMVEVGIPNRSASVTLGLMVDRVLDVRVYAAAAIEPPPELGVRWHAEHIRGVLRGEQGFAILLDLASIFSGEAEAVLLVTSADAPG